MNAGQLQSLKDLIEFLKQHDVGEFELEQEDIKVHLTFAGHSTSAGQADLSKLAQLLQAPQPAAPAISGSAMQTGVASAQIPSVTAAASPSAESSSSADGEEAGLHIVKSPIVGTFYEAPSPGTPPFVKVGDQVEAGQVVCIVEAMKLMNEIECDAAGEVVKRMATSGQPVEYGQPLFAIRPR